MLLINCLYATLCISSNLISHNHLCAMAGVQIFGPGVPSTKFPSVAARRADILAEFVAHKEANLTWLSDSNILVNIVSG
jgi:hypothetical protein